MGKARSRKETGWKTIVGTAKQREAYWVYTQATIAMFGSVVWWIGVWDLMTEGRVDHRLGPNHQITPEYLLFLNHYDRTLLYCGIGWLLLVVSDSITMQPGCWSHLWHPSMWGVGLKGPLRHLVHVRFVLGALGMFCFWIATNDLFDYYVAPPTTLRDVCYLVGGLAVTVLTGTLEHLSFVYAKSTEDEAVINYQHPLWRRLLELLRVTLATFAQSTAWLGHWNLLGLDRLRNEEEKRKRKRKNREKGGKSQIEDSAIKGCCGFFSF